mmetsp:Transcript_5601/g.22053  ORF Transcript_5601/g.22053 Transcript_5601/m.22053 type:complete len:240 (+) Transcript_5601:645-1364(+)
MKARLDGEAGSTCTSDPQSPDAFRGTKLVADDCNHVHSECSRLDRYLSTALRGVGVKEDVLSRKAASREVRALASRLHAFDDLRDVLDGAHFVVRVHDRDEHRVFCHGVGHRILVYESFLVHPGDAQADLFPSLELLQIAQHRNMFDGACYHMREAPFARRPTAGESVKLPKASQGDANRLGNEEGSRQEGVFVAARASPTQLSLSLPQLVKVTSLASAPSIRATCSLASSRAALQGRP